MTQTLYMSKLPDETKELVNQGFFSCYSLEPGQDVPDTAKYVLYAGKHAFLLDESGDVVKEHEMGTRYKVVDAINFAIKKWVVK